MRRVPTFHRVVESDGFTACHFPRIYPGYLGIRYADVNITAKWAFRAALCREGQRDLPMFSDFYLEEYDLFSRAGEVGFFCSRFNDFDLIVGFDVHGNILDVLFHGEQGYRNFDHVSRGEQARHRDVEHQRFVDLRAFARWNHNVRCLGNDHCA